MPRAYQKVGRIYEAAMKRNDCGGCCRLTEAASEASSVSAFGFGGLPPEDGLHG
jgi:hypothetical protein